MSGIYDLDRLLKEKLTNQFRKGYTDVKGYCLPNRFVEIANSIENLEVRDQDTWVCSFPKTGTTWVQEMVWCIANDMDFNGAKVLLSTRFPFLEATSICYRFSTTDETPHGSRMVVKEELMDSVGFVDRLPSPRYIKTHLPFSLLPEEIRTGERKPKIIYVTRNPKDTCISYYHHCRRLLFDKITFDEFYTLFLGGKVSYGPFWDHVLSYQNERTRRKNILILDFEEMIANLPAVIMKTADFLGKQIGDEEIKDLTEHLSFERMIENPAINNEEIIEPFTKVSAAKIETKSMKCGQVGQWKNYMSTKVVEKFDKLTKEKFKH